MVTPNTTRIEPQQEEEKKDEQSTAQQQERQTLDNELSHLSGLSEICLCFNTITVQCKLSVLNPNKMASQPLLQFTGFELNDVATHLTQHTHAHMPVFVLILCANSYLICLYCLLKPG